MSTLREIKRLHNYKSSWLGCRLQMPRKEIEWLIERVEEAREIFESLTRSQGPYGFPRYGAVAKWLKRVED